jgi:hypothetical protein
LRPSARQRLIRLSISSPVTGNRLRELVDGHAGFVVSKDDLHRWARAAHDPGAWLTLPGMPSTAGHWDPSMVAIGFVVLETCVSLLTSRKIGRIKIKRLLKPAMAKGCARLSHAKSL